MATPARPVSSESGAGFMAMADDLRRAALHQDASEANVALTRHAEDVIDAVDAKLVDQDLAAGAKGIGGHASLGLAWTLGAWTGNPSRRVD